MSCGEEEISVPSPATPAAISSASDSAQIRLSTKTCCRKSPWRRMKAFWAPIAMISEAPRKKPEIAAVTTALDMPA